MGASYLEFLLVGKVGSFRDEAAARVRRVCQPLADLTRGPLYISGESGECHAAVA